MNEKELKKLDDERKMWKRSYLQEKEKVGILMEAVYEINCAAKACDRVKVLKVD